MKNSSLLLFTYVQSTLLQFDYICRSSGELSLQHYNIMNNHYIGEYMIKRNNHQSVLQIVKHSFKHFSVFQCITVHQIPTKCITTY